MHGKTNRPAYKFNGNHFNFRHCAKNLHKGFYTRVRRRERKRTGCVSIWCVLQINLQINCGAENSLRISLVEREQGFHEDIDVS